MTVPTAVSRPLTPLIIGPLASSLTPTMIIRTAGLSVGPLQFTTTTTTNITIPKTTLIIIPTTTTMMFLSRIITTAVSQPEASLILRPNAMPTMIFPSTILIIPKTTPITIPAATTTIVLFLKKTMITIRTVTSLVPPIPLPPIATLTMPLLEEIIRIM